MHRSVNALLPAALASLALLLAGCGGSDVAGPRPGAGAMPDFSLTDVNPGSASFNRPVSPRMYLGKVSGWYFGHST
ncbi:MAG TPA: hypothetical protein VMS93_07995 [Candidatus Saccharimonadales bacterium]|nr:hypothetical protein [Candidatus Saccharimonadales bacterium]